MELNQLNLLKGKVASAHSPQLPKQGISQQHNKKQKRLDSVARNQRSVWK